MPTAGNEIFVSTLTGDDLDKMAAIFGVVPRRLQDDGPIDVLSGLPMESDASLRERIRERILMRSCPWLSAPSFIGEGI